jgi:hypothetical protein
MTDGNLIANLERVFGSKEFDATEVWREARHDQQLAAAIDAEVPRSRYKSGLFKGGLNCRAIRGALKRSKGLRHDSSYLFRLRRDADN